LTESLFYYYWYVCKVFMRSSKWFLRKLVFWLSWKIAKMDIIHYNNQAATSYIVTQIVAYKKFLPFHQKFWDQNSFTTFSKRKKKVKTKLKIKQQANEKKCIYKSIEMHKLRLLLLTLLLFLLLFWCISIICRQLKHQHLI
jgi:hypothetical protein